jgi:predicted DNA-binding protein with PD1-like motif
MKMFCRLEVKQRLMEAISALAANEKIHAACILVKKGSYGIDWLSWIPDG